jgi:beta-lysine 5,6-aminomutase alpha subunit
MTSKLNVDPEVVGGCREAAQQIAHHTAQVVLGQTTVSVERTVARLLGVDGADGPGVPLANVLVDHVHERGQLGHGIAHWLGIAIASTGRSLAEIATAVSTGELDPCELVSPDDEQARQAVRAVCASRMRAIDRGWDERRALRERLGDARGRFATC